ACAEGIKDGGMVRSELESTAVPTCNEDSPATLLFRCGSGRKKIIRFEARRFRILESAGGNQFRQHIELLEQGVVKFAAALVSWKFFVPISGDFQCVPGDKHGTRLLVAIEAEQHVGKAKDCTGGLIAKSCGRFWKGGVGKVHERIPLGYPKWVDGKRASTPAVSLADRQRSFL